MGPRRGTILCGVFGTLKRVKTLHFINEFARLVEQYGIPVEWNANLVLSQRFNAGRWFSSYRSSADSTIDNPLNILAIWICGQKQVNVEGVEVVDYRFTSRKHGARYVEV